MKLTRTFRLLLTGDADAQKLFDPTSLDRAETLATVVKHESSGVRTVVAEAEGVAIPFGGIATAGFVLLAVDKDIVVRINGGDDITVKKASSGRGLFYLEGAVTAIEVDNLGTEDATVLYALAGV